MIPTTDKRVAIFGMGVTGLSCARYFQRRGQAFVGFDNSLSESSVAALQAEFSESEFVVGALEEDDFTHFTQLVVSPGISLDVPAVRRAAVHGVEITGDIDLFRREVSAPIVAITGSNGKSTVTKMVGDMARQAGLTVAVGGNIGTPVLDFLDDGVAYDLVVLELSSYQLERTPLLAAEVASVLNLSDDHMDRYQDAMAYHSAKHRIYRGCHNVVFNRGDRMTRPSVTRNVEVSSFGLTAPDGAQFGVDNGYLCKGQEQLLEINKLPLNGSHNVLNAVAALALGESAGLPMDAMLRALCNFEGLPHRCQKVATVEGVSYYNDSKGTNVGATMAAINGLTERQSDIVLIAGGVGKGADFSPLLDSLVYLKGAVLIGEMAAELERLMNSKIPCRRADDMAAALAQATDMAASGDKVLLSPACASFDMYPNFEARGQAFHDAVQTLGSGGI